jgi:hypothetical protein
MQMVPVSILFTYIGKYMLCLKAFGTSHEEILGGIESHDLTSSDSASRLPFTGKPQIQAIIMDGAL